MCHLFSNPDDVDFLFCPKKSNSGNENLYYREKKKEKSKQNTYIFSVFGELAGNANTKKGAD